MSAHLCSCFGWLRFVLPLPQPRLAWLSWGGSAEPCPPSQGLPCLALVAKGWAEGGWNGDSWSEGSDPWRGKSQGKAETKHTGSIKPGMEENSLRFKALLDWFDQGEWYRWGEAAQGRQRRW